MSRRRTVSIVLGLTASGFLASGCSLVGSYDVGDCVSVNGGAVEEVDCDSADADQKLGQYPDDCADGERALVLSRGGDEKYFCPIDVE
ncbi:hypothetical protein GCM10010531_44760 [Blastococcus jejuensis]|uniref:Uncharacterized protein n=1 Tax=Blastococcus jejuensis TaxID=351224 RepID=A0ABP6PQB9_9ACTN